MRKEKIKTGILLILIACTVVLTLNVWFGSGIWPHGYDFFVSLSDRAFFSRLFQKEQPYLSPMESLAKPQKLVVTNGGNRAVYYVSDVSYAPFYEEVKAFFGAVLSDESRVQMVTEVDVEEWYDVLRNDEILDTRSIYAEYNSAFSPALFAKVTGIADTWLASKIDSVREFIVAPVGEGGEDMLLYVREYNTGRIIKCYIRYEGKAPLYEKIAAMTENTNYSYAFELNLHIGSGGIGEAVQQKVVCSPQILIAPNATRGVGITAENPVETDMNMEELLSVFQYTERTPNRYIGTDGTVHFVENYGSVNLYPDGVVEYYALNEEKGVDLLPVRDGAVTLYDSLNGAVRLAEKVWRALVPDMPFDAIVSGDLLEKDGDSYTFYMDYYHAGTPVITTVGDTYHPAMQHAVEMEVKNGRLIRYRHFIRRFESVGEPFQNVTMLEAVDGIYMSLPPSQDTLQIKDLFLAYLEDTTPGTKKPVWCARVEGQDALICYAP